MFILAMFIASMIGFEAFKIINPSVERKALAESRLIAEQPVLNLKKEDYVPNSKISVLPGQKIAIDGVVVMKSPHSKEYNFSLVISFIYTLMLLCTLFIAYSIENYVLIIGVVGIHISGAIIRKIGKVCKCDVVQIDAIVSITMLINMIIHV